MHLIDQSGEKILPDRGDPAVETDVLTIRSIGRALKRGVDAIGDEVLVLCGLTGVTTGHL